MFVVQDPREATEAELVNMIREDWSKVNYAAAPYLQAMTIQVHNGASLFSDPYGADYPGSIVRYFLSNASSWRGETAKAVKAELKRRLA